MLECQELGIITFKSEKENTKYKINVSKTIKDIKVGNKTLRGEKYEEHSDVKISQIELLEMNIIITEIKKSTD